VKDNEAAAKHDIIFEEPQQSPKHFFADWSDEDYLKMLEIEPGDGWPTVACKLEKFIWIFAKQLKEAKTKTW
jgi:predicted nucleic acid-binding protein